MSLTSDQARQAWAQIIGADAAASLQQWPIQVTPAMRIPSAQLAAGTTTGSCCYSVNGTPECVDGVTQAECKVSLGGIFDVKTCAQRIDKGACPPVVNSPT
jgi:hypothetical protein